MKYCECVYLSIGHAEVVVRLIVAVAEQTAQLAQVETIHLDVADLPNKRDILTMDIFI